MGATVPRQVGGSESVKMGALGVLPKAPTPVDLFGRCGTAWAALAFLRTSKIPKDIHEPIIPDMTAVCFKILPHSRITDGERDYGKVHRVDVTAI